MSYAEKNLAPGETIVYRARYHWIYYKTTLVLLLVAAVFGLWWWISGNALEDPTTSSIFGNIGLLFLFAAAVHFVVRRIRSSADEYVVTNRRVIRKYGLVAREVEQALLDRIQDITLRQGITARLLGYGTVVLETASETGRLTFPDIAAPEEFRKAVWDQQTGAVAAPAALAAPAAPPVPTTATRLAELEDLKARGLLSAEEYARKREQILSSL
ncbi:MAG TPA: PH domain-containing protein [Thermoanaerobaculia bacterium]|nr:PH domain-containing protein [Thermoanaerobaculia bacterium]